MTPARSKPHRIDDLVTLFNQTFEPIHNTRLVCCESEPIYRPADETHSFHRIVFAHGFYASALHEISHWCIAGQKRRLLEDFGYWYEPDGRTEDRQAEFEKVEIKPQALEWIFSMSANFQFHFSADNLEGNAQPSQRFVKAVNEQVKNFLTEGLPKDAQLWSDTLIGFYRPNQPLTLNEFKLDKR
jgi:elongation factor P hydroxylase